MFQGGGIRRRRRMRRRGGAISVSSIKKKLLGAKSRVMGFPSRVKRGVKSRIKRTVLGGLTGMAGRKLLALSEKYKKGGAVRRRRRRRRGSGFARSRLY